MRFFSCINNISCYLFYYAWWIFLDCLKYLYSVELRFKFFFVLKYVKYLDCNKIIRTNAFALINTRIYSSPKNDFVVYSEFRFKFLFITRFIFIKIKFRFNDLHLHLFIYFCWRSFLATLNIINKILLRKQRQNI